LDKWSFPMKSIIIFCIFYFLLFTFLLAQETWIKTYQPFTEFYPYPDCLNYFPEDIVVCQDNAFAVNGYYIYSDGWIYEQWGFLMKTDGDGNMLWAKLDSLSFMEENKSLAFVETSDDGFISGISGGNLIKRDSEGNREWVIDGDFGINSMCNTEDGNIILGGTQSLNIGLRKIDEEGETLWTKVYQIDDDYSICKSIIQTNDGGYALTGYFDYQGRPDADILVMKTDANGDSLWTKTYDGYGHWDTGKSITEDTNGNIMVVGELDDINYITIGFLWYLDEDGNTIWTQEVESSVGHSHFSVLYITEDNFIAYCYSGSGGNRETTIYQFDSNYNINWLSEFDANVARGDKTICVLTNENFIFPLMDVSGMSNIGIAKTDSQGQVSIDNEMIYYEHLNLSNYPNPFNLTTTIYFELPKRSLNSLIEIFNVKGQLIQQLPLNKTMKSVLWNGADNNRNSVSSGIYYYRIKGCNFESQTKKMLLLK